jgi:DNA-binding NtrC family response regulator
MSGKPSLLIVDRNPNVREYLKRELRAEGYKILLAENCREMFELMSDAGKVDLVIIDPDLPDAEEVVLFRKLESLRSRIPVLIHTLLADCRSRAGFLKEAEFIEKDGNSIDRLKNEIVLHLEGLPPSPASLESDPLKQSPSHLAEAGECGPEQ